MSSTPVPVMGALHLRAWALATLCGRGAPAPPPAATAEAWRLFLGTEQCAAALLGRASGVMGVEAARVAGEMARAESRSVLSARAQLRRISALARERGLRVAVLKGGAALLRGGEGTRVLDLDLLATPADAAALAAGLDAAGYRAFGGAASHRLAVRAVEGDIPLEIHTAVPGLPAGDEAWARAQPAPDGRGLFVLHPADHLRYLLLHSAVQHVDRRGRLRDLLVLAEALEQCGAEEVREVEAAIAADPHSAVLADQLAMARAVAEGGPCRDRFEMTAAGTYVMELRLSASRLRGQLRLLAWQAGMLAVARRSGAPGMLGEHGLALPSAVPALAALRRVAPGAERTARTLIRRSREWALLPFARGVAAAAERAVQERAAAP